MNNKQFKKRGFDNGSILLSKKEQEAYKGLVRKVDYKALNKNKD